MSMFTRCCKKVISLWAMLLIAGCGDPGVVESTHEAGHAPSAAEFERGPQRGRLLRQGNFAMEITIFETGVPPRFRLYAYVDDKAVAPDAVSATIELRRLGGVVDQFEFKPEADYLTGNGTVVEPHSFDVTVAASHQGQNYLWNYASYEGRTTIAAPIAETAGVETAIAGPAVIEQSITLYGHIAADPERQREVSARYPGIIRSVSKHLGDSVQAGETLAAIESNESLRNYAITAPLTGVITARDANAGEQSGDRVLFTITDASSVVAELSVFPRDRARVVPGSTVRIALAEGEGLADGSIQRIEGQAGANQAVKARAAIANTKGLFLPGSFITAEVVSDRRAVPLAVRRIGLQAYRDFTVVYAQVGETYEVRMLELGSQNAEWSEVLSGLAPGTRYVTENSYLIKADIEKSAASHDH